jgi:hypothetical protein
MNDPPFLPYHIYHKIEFWSWLECESSFFSIYVEFDFSYPDINVSIGGAQKGSPKDE